MIQPPHPRPGIGLLRLAAWSTLVGVAWLLVGQQLHGQPAIRLDLTAGLPGAPSVNGRPAAPHRQPSPPHSTGTSPQQRHSTAALPRASTPTSQAPARAVTFALSQQGKPYVYSAEGPDAYDCSGLVWLAWQHAGLVWERMSAAGQWQWLHQHGHDVPATQLRPGDLLFFAYDPHDPASIHHVAMHVGHGRMIEAYAPGYPVRVTSVRWQGFFGAARPSSARWR